MPAHLHLLVAVVVVPLGYGSLTANCHLYRSPGGATVEFETLSQLKIWAAKLTLLLSTGRLAFVARLRVWPPDVFAAVALLRPPNSLVSLARLSTPADGPLQDGEWPGRPLVDVSAA